MGEGIGRVDEVNVPHVADLPNRVGSAMLTNQDKIIDALVAITAKLETEGGLSNGWPALVASIKKLDVIL